MVIWCPTSPMLFDDDLACFHYSACTPPPPKKPWSKLKKLNYFLCQLLFFRIARVIEQDKQVGYNWMFPIIPFTGWNSDYYPPKYFSLPIYRRAWWVDEGEL